MDKIVTLGREINTDLSRGTVKAELSYREFKEKLAEASKEPCQYAEYRAKAVLALKARKGGGATRKRSVMALGNAPLKTPAKRNKSYEGYSLDELRAEVRMRIDKNEDSEARKGHSQGAGQLTGR